MPRKIRDYKDEYQKYHSQPEQKKNRAARNAARTMVTATKGKAAVAGRDVDHKTPLSKGGSNSPGNLRLKSPGANRSYKRNKKGGIK